MNTNRVNTATNPFDICVNSCSSVANFLSPAEEALATLEAALALPLTGTSRDSAIWQFSFSFDACWKAAHTQDSESGSLADVLIGCWNDGLIDRQDAEALLTMAKDRSLMFQTYDEKLAQELYGRLPGHAELMRRWLELVKPGD
jgi:hypothetical protein